METYDLVVIGSGVAAKAVAFRVRAAGWSVAMVDGRPFGGTCQLRGCDPKKALISGAEVVDFTGRMTGKGVSGEVRIDWPTLMVFKRGFTDPVPQQSEKSLSDAGIDTLHGTARFIGEDRLSVNGHAIGARHVLLAVGARPRPMGIPGAEYLTTSDQFMAHPELPERIVMVGGGYIAAEFSHLAARAGAQVTVFEHGPHMLTHFEPDLVEQLMPRFAAIGVTVHTNSDVIKIDKAGNGFQVHVKSEGQQHNFDVNMVVHAAGRVPALEELDLAAAGISTTDGHIRLTEHLQSVSNPRVYAAGDAAAKGPPLTPVAAHDAGVVARNLLEGNKHTPNYAGVPSVAFTVPPIAAVGLSEREARERGLRFDVHRGNAAGWYSARRIGESVYAYKTLVETGSGRILGAHVVGPEADTTINIFALAIRQGLTDQDLKQTIFAYPTAASDISAML